MTVSRTVLVFALAVASCQRVVAEDCNAEKALERKLESLKALRTSYLNQIESDVNAIRDLLKKAPLKDVPVGEQLGAADQDRFKEISQRMILTRQKEVIEGTRMGQVNMLLGLYRISEFMADTEIKFASSGGQADDFDWDKVPLSSNVRAGVKVLLKLEPLWADDTPGAAPPEK